MQCELCGNLTQEAFKVKVEGSVVVACANCAGLGKVIERITPEEKKKKPPEKPSEPIETFEVEDEWELIHDYAGRIRSGRERMDLKQEDLAKAIAEPASLIHRIESGKMIPSPSVGRKLEKKLGVRLYEKTGVEEAKSSEKKEGGEVTLGDVIVVRKRGK